MVSPTNEHSQALRPHPHPIPTLFLPPTHPLTSYPTRFPALLHSRLQACLTAAWTTHLPFLQSRSPAQLISSALLHELGPDIASYTFIDCCAGAGGPTPTIERLVNGALARQARSGSGSKSRSESASEPNDGASVPFVLADIKPLPREWRALTRQSPGQNLHYIPQSLDASRPFEAEILDRAEPPLPSTSSNPSSSSLSAAPTKPFRLFILSYHHFPDPLALAVLQSTLSTCSGFAIIELQDRTIASFLTIFLLGPLSALLAPFLFWRDPVHLFFTYVLPIVPAVLVFDGYVSSLRTRGLGEVLGLLGPEGGLRREEALEGWDVRRGEEFHTWPIGKASWIVGTKD